MGLTADTHIDPYHGTGSSHQYVNPPGVHLMLSREELENRYGFYQASGGALSTIYSVTLSGSNHIPTLIEQQSHNKLATTVQTIGSVFCLTKDELAQVCHVQSRKTLYNWIDGKANPRKTAMYRIFDLYTIAQAWKQAGFISDKVALHRPILDQLSLFDLLVRDSLDKELVLFAGSRLTLSSPTSNKIEDPFA